MSHPPASVIVTASGTRDDFRACLESLRPALGVRDEAVCVVPADRPDLRRVLDEHPWLTVLADTPENGAPEHGAPADQAARWSAGLAATTAPIVVFLDGDVIGSAHWLDPLAQAFEDPGVVAAGPRCHRSYGPQGTELPRRAMVNAAGFKAYARDWRREHQGTTVVDRLGPVCVAVRREALTAAGGPGPAGFELPWAALAERGTLLIVDGALVAHVGADRCALRQVAGPRPLISASMIVKDEEDVLGVSLAALREFVDEIVVYDTGSTDRTIEIAREHGARVVEGYWNDHFADARNRSIAHCRGEWIFVVDADEIASGDPALVRARLADATGASRMILVQSLEGHGHEGRGVVSVRFFRHTGRYAGRLHEQVVDGITGEPLRGPMLDGVELTHSGYTQLRYATKNKGERNVRLAELAVEDQAGSFGALANLARSQVFANQPEDAIDVCRQALAAGGGGYQLTFLEVLVYALVSMRRFDDADAALEEMRELPGGGLIADDMAARLRFTEGRYAETLEILERFPERATDAQRMMVMSRSQLADIEIMSLYHLGRAEAAAEVLYQRLAEGEIPMPVPHVAKVLDAVGRSITAIAELLPPRGLHALMLALTEAPVSLADELLEVLWHQHAGDGTVLALAARVGPRLSVLRSLEWAARLRGSGFTGSCTLVGLAGTGFRAPRDRAVAAAIALEMYRDERAMPLLAQALEAVPEEQEPTLLDELRLLAPGIAAAIEPAGVA